MMCPRSGLIRFPPVNKQGELVVGNVLQKIFFHYVENEFLSEKIV